jgi:hypothetical protein
MRIGKSGWFFLAVLVLLAWHYAPRALGIVAPNFIESVQDRSIYYRLLAKYQHGDEIIDFDIVVGCGVRVTRWGDGDKSYDAFRDPVVFAKATKDGNAVLQIVPSACRGQTTENGEVPDDFLPGALWFEHADDLSFGIAYVTEDAFDSPRSKLKFLGASIHPAGREDYVAFEPIAAKNLIDPRPLFSFLPLPTGDQIKPRLGNSRELSRIWPGMFCSAVRRLHLTDPAQRLIVADYWPDSKPRYWSPTWQELERLNKSLGIFSRMIADGRKVTDYRRLNDYRADGFPTRAQGGTIGSKHETWDKLPPTVFPLRRDEGIPWLTPDYLTATTLHRHVDIFGGENQGFAYCYSQIPGDGLGVPAYLNGSFTTVVDGEPILGEKSDMRSTETPTARDRPHSFFERDEYFYVQDTFGLN